MNIIILCDQTDCIHNKRYNGQERIGSQGSNACYIQPGYLPITRDYEADEPAIRTVCLSKETKGIITDVDLKEIGQASNEYYERDKLFERKK